MRPASAAPGRRLNGRSLSIGTYQDAAEDGRFVEAFLLQSSLEDLRQHERVTNADRKVPDAVHRFSTGAPPEVTHFIAADG